MTNDTRGGSTRAAHALAAGPAWAQSTATGTLTGIVQDGNGGVLPGVTVTATQPATGLVRTSVTASQGEWTLPTLPPGEYTLTFELASFKKLVRPGVVVESGVPAQRERHAGTGRHLRVDHGERSARTCWRRPRRRRFGG